MIEGQIEFASEVEIMGKVLGKFEILIFVILLFVLVKRFFDQTGAGYLL